MLTPEMLADLQFHADFASNMYAKRVYETAIAECLLSIPRHVEEQREFSATTFGPGTAAERFEGIRDHIQKELRELEAAPMDLEEWIDVAILALDGAWRTGASSEEIANAFAAKLAKNKSRKWPDWRTATPGKAIEHVREEDER